MLELCSKTIGRKSAIKGLFGITPSFFCTLLANKMSKLAQKPLLEQKTDVMPASVYIC